MKESFQQPNKNNSIRNLKLAAMISLGLIAGTKGVAQVSKQDTTNTNKIETSDSISDEAVKKLETILKTFHLGNQLDEYEKQVDMIISQKINLSEEQLQRIFSFFPEYVRLLNKQSKNKVDWEKRDETMNKIFPINRKLLSYIYQGDKSPFAEFDGPLSFNFEKNIDSSLPDIEGRKLFNLVFNNKFKYDSNENNFEEDKNSNTIKEGSCNLYKADQSVIVRLTLNDGSVGMFQVTIRTKDQEFLYIYSEFNPDKPDSTADYETIKKAFLEYFK